MNRKLWVKATCSFTYSNFAYTTHIVLIQSCLGTSRVSFQCWYWIALLWEVVSNWGDLVHLVWTGGQWVSTEHTITSSEPTSSEHQLNVSTCTNVTKRDLQIPVLDIKLFCLLRLVLWRWSLGKEILERWKNKQHNTFIISKKFIYLFVKSCVCLAVFVCD